jgi:hypothetical protein
MRSRLSLRAASPRALACAALLAGCGSSATSGNGVAAKTPVQIVAAARAAVAGAASVHVAGSIVSEGKPISLNMELVADKGGMGRVALEGLSFRLVGVDDAVYVSGSAAFYKRFAGRASARVLNGKWLKGAGDGAMASLASLTRLRTLLGSMLAAHGTLSRAPSRSIAGKSAVGVRDIAGAGTLYVASTGAPYPLEILERGANAGKLVFDGWNQPVSLSVPADAIDVKQLQSGR